LITINLQGRTALVTGGSGGLGGAISTALATAGAQVAVHYRSGKEAADAIVESIVRSGGKARAFQADISDPEEVDALLQQIELSFGGLDILVNNAGIDGPRTTVGADDPKTWEKVLRINLFGPYYCSRAAIARMEKNRRGVIVNMTSVHEFIPWEGYSAYASAKAGLSMFTKTLAQETADKGIRVVAVAPGAIRTPINESVWDNPDSLKDLDQKIAMGRLGNPEEIAMAVLFLVSDLAAYITGTTLAVDGGMLIYPEFRHGG